MPRNRSITRRSKCSLSAPLSASPAGSAAGDRKVGDAALRDLVTPKDGCEEISGFAAWQRALDRHYAGE